MTDKELQAIEIADKYASQYNVTARVKWLGTELVELAMGIANDDKENIQEEIGDMAYILLHIASLYGDKGLEDLVEESANKMVTRNNLV